MKECVQESTMRSRGASGIPSKCPPMSFIWTLMMSNDSPFLWLGCVSSRDHNRCCFPRVGHSPPSLRWHLDAVWALTTSGTPSFGNNTTFWSPLHITRFQRGARGHQVPVRVLTAPAGVLYRTKQTTIIVIFSVGVSRLGGGIPQKCTENMRRQ